MSELRAEVEVINKLGLHARAAGLLVKRAQEFKDAELYLSKDGYEINGKSIMGVLTLAAAKGEKVLIRTSGTQAKELLDAMCELFAARFNEPE